MANGMLGLSIGRSALGAHQRALEVTSQNIANANTEGYTRKIVTMQASTSLNLPDVQGVSQVAQVGTGVEISRIESVRDLLLNDKIRDLTSDFKDSEKTRQILDQVEALFAGEIDIAESLDNFFSSLHDLAGSPDSLTIRAVVRSRGVEVANRIQIAATSVEELRVDMASEMADKATLINSISAELAKLNEQASAMTSNDLQPNDFEDRRQVLLEQLSELGDVQTTPGSASSLNVLLGSQVIVQGFQSFDVSTVSNGPDLLPSLAVGGSLRAILQPVSGQLRAFQDLQDGTLSTLRGDLNELAVSLTESFNTIHSTGFGLNGTTGVDFFTLGTPPSTESRLYSVLGTSFVERLDVALDGDATTVQTENFESNPIGTGSFVINGIGISYNGSTDTLQTVVDRINNSAANVTATVTPENRLLLSARRGADFVISNMSDSQGTFLSRMGILPASSAYPPTNGANPPTSVFTGEVALRPADDAARRFAVTDEIIADLGKIAAAKGDDLSSPPDGRGDRSRGPGDGANALLLAGLRETDTMSGNTSTYNEYIAGMLGTIGVEAGAAKRTEEGLEAQIDQLKSRREEIQGVSLDEELINMIKYQRGFQAASRIISTMDEVLQTLIALGQ
ncbi:MAG: flagellar hook-associated protein FlgK [Candidatus Hydrogenedentota bacterium]